MVVISPHAPCDDRKQQDFYNVVMNEKSPSLSVRNRTCFELLKDYAKQALYFAVIVHLVLSLSLNRLVRISTIRCVEHWRKLS